MLAAKLVAGKTTMAQLVPQAALLRRQVAAQLPGVICAVFH
ncbi:hypothetical protein KLQUMA228M_00625 [Klebsiella quasipneumoniae subsp. quasipneumoniae]|nr:hypothetical protein BANRA_01321 [Klebsiella quasipneumoniae]VGO86648.1 hypothetical protein SB01124_01212 [Klebsiella quasipneumoniae subsp. quasipneumoniae]